MATESSSSSSSASFKATELSLSIQKKVFSRMANKHVLKHLIDDTSGSLLDNVQKLAKCYVVEAKQRNLSTTKDMDKVVKHLIKIIVKIAVLMLNEQFTPAELQLAERLQRSLRSTLMTVVSFHEVDFSYDQTYLISSLNTFRDQLKQLIKPHLSDKSANRVDTVFNFLTNPDFLDRFFEQQQSQATAQTVATDPIYKIRCDLASDVNTLLEKGRI